jgi:hypothetical protein
MSILSTGSSLDVNEALLGEMTAMRKEIRQMADRSEAQAEMARKEVAAMRKEMADKIDQMSET